VRVVALLAISLFALGWAPAVAVAGSPSPSPPASPPPTPSGSPTAAPSPSRAASPTPSPSPSVAPEIDAADARVADEMRRVIAAASLAERIDAQRRLATAERDVLVRESARIREAQAATAARAAELQVRLAEKRATLERILEEAYRSSRVSPLEALLRRGSIVDVLVHVEDLAKLSAKQREVIDQLRDIERDIAEEQGALARQESDLTRLSEAVTAKDATLARLGARAEALAAATQRGAAAVSDAEIDLLRDLADQAAREHEEADRLIAEIAQRAGVALPALDRWAWPATGPVSQEFGPSVLVFEPPLGYRGVAYAHFHDGIDIATALGAPVRAVARGRVAFVGHLADGAMVAIVAHEGGLVSLYAHLDDAVARPTVHVGDVVEAGERIGSVGLTGLTTGPHLHFSLRRGTEPLDPRSRLP